MSEIFHAVNLDDAISMAEEFKKQGKYDLFRGQAQNWLVKSSLGRLHDQNAEIQKRLERLYLFFDSSTVLKKYKTDIDWFWAVAQHYGLETNYIDFTSNPKVAAFFATNSKFNTQGEYSVIICLNQQDWKSFMSGLEGYFRENKVLPPYIVHIDVDNLWRLQAQEGCFMFTPYNNIEFFYDFDRIIFPYSKPYMAIKSSHIYPKRKSELEQLLDHFFNMEERIKGSERFKQFVESLNMPITHVGKLEYDHFFKRKKKHSSWYSSEFKKWNFPLTERWESVKKSTHISLLFDFELPTTKQIENLCGQISGFFKKRKVNRQTHIKFFINSSTTISKKELKLIQRNCMRAWEGMRNLPFLDGEIICVISQVIVTGIMKQLNNKTLSLSGEELLLLEMTSEYGNSAKCCVSPSVILKAFREDIFEVLVNDAPRVLQPEILLHINNPYLLFDFHLLLEAFKNEMICYQILRQQSNDNPVVFFSPAQINGLGYA